MGKTAQEYLRSRNRALDSSGSTKPLNTELAGVTVAEQRERMRAQQISDEEARMTARGLVPVAIDFANIARACGVEVLRDDATFAGPNSWVPAWFLAAHHGYRGAPGMLGAPTDDFERYIRGILDDVREQVMLVAEFQLTAPFQGAATVAGVHAWLEEHARDL